MKVLLQYLVDRMKEPTTWLGIGSLVTAIGWQISPELWQSIAGVGMGIGGMIAVFVRERAS